MRRMDFGPYETTARTVWRQSRDPFRPRYQMDREIMEDLRASENAERELGYLREDQSIARKVSEITLEENVFATMRLAGREITLDEVRTTIARRPAFRHGGSATEREMLNLGAFMDRLDEIPVPRTVEDLATQHRSIFEGVEPDAGILRDRPTFEPGGGRDEVGFVPSMPDQVHPELQGLLDWLHETDEPPLIRAALFMEEIQSIQPFLRGNGRLARAVAQVILYHGGCEAIPYVLLDHTLYRTHKKGEERFMESERNADATPWMKYYVRVAREAYEGSVQRFLLHQRSDGLLNERQLRVAEWFARRHTQQPGRRHRFSEIHTAFPDIPERTLQRDLATLRESGILKMEGKWKGARYVYLEEPLEESQTSPGPPGPRTP